MQITSRNASKIESTIKNYCNYSAKGLVFNAEVDFNQWEFIGEHLKYMKGRLNLWLGDWINYGENKFKEKYTQALEATDYKGGSLRNYASVAGRIPIDRRKEGLTYTHYKIILAKTEDEKEQDKLINMAFDRKLSTRELDEHLEEKKAIDVPTEEEVNKFEVMNNTILDIVKDTVQAEKIASIYTSKYKKQDELIKLKSEAAEKLEKENSSLKREIGKLKTIIKELESKLSGKKKEEKQSTAIASMPYRNVWVNYYNKIMSEKLTANNLRPGIKSSLNNISKNYSIEQFTAYLQFIFDNKTNMKLSKEARRVLDWILLNFTPNAVIGKQESLTALMSGKIGTGGRAPKIMNEYDEKPDPKKVNESFFDEGGNK